MALGETWRLLEFLRESGDGLSELTEVLHGANLAHRPANGGRAMNLLPESRLPRQADRPREETIQRVHCLARPDEVVEESRRSDLSLAESHGGEEVLPPEVHDERMVRVDSRRVPFHGVALYGVLAADHLPPFVRLRDDPVTNLRQRRCVRVPHPGARERFAGLEVDVEARGHVLRPLALGVPEVDRDVRLVRALVRREADVAVDPGEGAAERTGVRDEVRRQGLELRARIADEAEARLLDRGLVAGLVLGEPLAVVVLRQVLQESEEVWREVLRTHTSPRRGRHNRSPSSTLRQKRLQPGKYSST